MMKIKNPILEELRRLILEKSRITFKKFMEKALYHQEYGYYTSNKARIGKDGDYYTSSDVHKAFGFCIMRQIKEMKDILNQSPLSIVEFGAGKGLLCADILTSAREKSPPLFKDIRYFIIEKSPDFIERQKRYLQELGITDKVFWASDIKDALSDGIGIVLSNELIDAFPVHKVRYSEGRWNEVYVTIENDKFIETEDDLSNQRLTDFLHALSSQGEGGLNSAFEEGYTTEVNLKAVDWIRAVGGALKKGFVITIDYGYPRKELYSPERNRGTVMCYYKHRASEDPYLNIGEQDITAHIDFTSLAYAGLSSGLEITGFTDQTYFLMGCGIEEEFRTIAEINQESVDAFKRNITLKKLLMPGGMGTTFKVLIQHKGMEKPELRGFSFKDTANRLRMKDEALLF